MVDGVDAAEELVDVFPISFKQLLRVEGAGNYYDLRVEIHHASLILYLDWAPVKEAKEEVEWEM